MEVSGRVIAHQEQRLRLLTDSGQVYLLTLTNRTRLGTDQLSDYQTRGARLAVRFDGQPNLTGGVVVDVREVDR
ncbi:MAG: hypothetical protein JOZ87_11160 [Chloroflexi bacterium]|nr:hypothetical protein [Chloroflexota bacterium]